MHRHIKNYPVLKLNIILKNTNIMKFNTHRLMPLSFAFTRLWHYVLVAFFPCMAFCPACGILSGHQWGRQGGGQL